MPDSRTENRIFLRIFSIAIAIVLIVTIGYLLFGEQIIKHFYEGGSIPGFVPARQPDGRTLEEYTTAAAGRFWQNTVIGIPLSLIFLFLLYRLYKWLLLRPDPMARRKSFTPDTHMPYGVFIAGSVYALLTLIYFYPMLQTFTRAMIGPASDNMACLWTLSWGSTHLFSSPGTLRQVDVLFYPEGSSFLYHAWSFYNLYLYWGLHHFFGAVTCYNLLILHTFPFAGIGGYLFARYYTKNHWLALLAGFLFAFCPAHLDRSYHHMNIATIQFVPLFLLWYIKTIRRESRWGIVWTTVFLLLSALVDWNYLVYGLWFMIFSYIYLAVRRHRLWLPDVVKVSTVSFAATLLIVSPWVVPMIREAFGSAVNAGGHNTFVVDLAGLITPYPLHLLGGIDLVSWINQSFSSWHWETTAYLGIVALTIVVLAWKNILSEIVGLLLGAISFLLLAFGAQPHFLGHMIPALTPGRIVPMLPLLANGRAPSRNIIFVYLFWSVIVSIAVGWIWQRLKNSKLRVALVALLVVLLVLDYYGSSTERTEVFLPPCYQVLPHGSERYGVLDLPSGWEASSRYMMYQDLHGFPIVQGCLARKTNQTLLDRLNLSDLAEQKHQLVEAKVKYVILHKEYLPSPSVNPGSYDQVYARIYDDSSNSVYQVY
jgi:hypothetical protein